MTDKCEMCAGTKVDTVFGGRCEWCDETGQVGGLTPLPNGPLAMLPAMLDAVNHGVGVMLISAKGAEHVPLKDFRRDIPRYKGMNVGLDSDCVLASDFDAAQSELTALREELAEIKESLAYRGSLLNRTRLRAEVAEQRNAELEKNSARYIWLRDKSESVHQFYLSTPIWFTGVKFNPENVDSAIDAAMTKPTESGASEDKCSACFGTGYAHINGMCVEGTCEDCRGTGYEESGASE
jgi:hypothetical protein